MFGLVCEFMNELIVIQDDLNYCNVLEIKIMVKEEIIVMCCGFKLMLIIFIKIVWFFQYYLSFIEVNIFIIYNTCILLLDVCE